MSSVRMSKVIRDKIIKTGDELFEKSLHKLHEALATDFHDRIAAEYIQYEFATYLSVVPDHWKQTVSQVTYAIDYNIGHVNGVTTEFAFDKMTLLKRPEIIKIDKMFNEGFGKIYTLCIPTEYQFAASLSLEITEWRNEIRKTHNEQEEFMDELKNILNRCNTIKQFLDIWPQGENLTPPDILARLNEKPLREKPEPILTEEASVTLSQTLLKRTLMS